MVDVQKIVSDLLLELAVESDKMAVRAEGVRLLYNRIVDAARKLEEGNTRGTTSPETSSEPVAEESREKETDPA